MTAFLRIDQAGLTSGTPGRSRTDGKADGSLVTLTDTGPVGTTAFHLLWTPPGDAGAVSSLAPTGDPKVWTFDPTTAKYGSYLVELVRNAGTVTETRERRVIAMRTPNFGLIIPALGEHGYSDASLANASGAELVDNNATDFSDPDLNALPFSAWWRALHELISSVDEMVSLIDDEAIAWSASQKFSGSLVLGTTQLQAVSSSPLAVVLGANVTRLYLFDGDADISSISGASDGRLVHVHVVSGTKRFTGHLRPGNEVYAAGPRESFWLMGDGGDWIVTATRPWVTAQGTGAMARLVRDRLANEVHVTDWMTPAQIADANNGTKLFDLQPAIQKAIDWLLFDAMGVNGSVRGRLRLPAGILRIDRTIQINYGQVYRTMIFEGEGILRGGEHGQTGTCIYANFGDAPAVAVSAGIDVSIKQMAIVGLNAEHILGIITGSASMDQLEPEAWVDPALPASASSRYAPYAGIAIDPYSGTEPVVHYPDVIFPPGFVGGQYEKLPSGNITIEDVRIDGFVVAVALQPCDYDGNGDFVHLNRVSMWYCTYGLSLGNSQARCTSMLDCTMAALHTGFTTTKHGRRIGMPQITLTACHFMTGIQILEVMNLGYGTGPVLTGCFAEAMYRVGKVNGQSLDAGGVTFRNCEFGLSWWERYGVPTWTLEMMGGMQVVLDTTFFYVTSNVNGWVGFRCTGSSMMDEPGRQLQVVGSQIILPERGPSLAERCAVNGTLGLVVSLGSTSLDRFSLTNGYITDLDTNTPINGPVLHTEQSPAPRSLCAPVYAKKLKSLTNGNDPGLNVAWRNRALLIASVVSTVGRVVTLTVAGVTAASLAHTGGDVGDAIVYHDLGGAAFFVKSRTGTTIVMQAMTGFDKDGNLLTAVTAGANLYTINCRRHVPSVVLYGDMTAGSPTITNVIEGNGNPPNLTLHFFPGDFIYVDDDVDKFIAPTDATLVSLDNTAKTLTFGGNFLFTRVRTRLGVFVRAAMPNA